MDVDLDLNLNVDATLDIVVDVEGGVQVQVQVKVNDHVRGQGQRWLDSTGHFHCGEVLGPRRALRAPWREAQGGSRRATRDTHLVPRHSESDRLNPAIVDLDLLRGR